MVRCCSLIWQEEAKAERSKLSAIFQLRERKKKKAFAVPEVIPVEQLKRLLPEVPSKDTQKQFMEIKKKKNKTQIFWQARLPTVWSPTSLLNEVHFFEGKEHIFQYRYSKDNMGCVYTTVTVVRVLLVFSADLWSDPEMTFILIKTEWCTKAQSIKNSLR